jgi:predicted phosphodiesterase
VKRLGDLREKWLSIICILLILPILSISLIDLFSDLKWLTTRSHQIVDPPSFQEDTTRFAVVGDTRSQLPLLGSSELWPNLLASMQNYFIHQEMRTLIHLGDLVKNGRNASEWHRLIKEMPPQIWAIQGNHDRGPYFKDLFRDQVLDHLQINEITCIWGFNTETNPTWHKSNVHSLPYKYGLNIAPFIQQALMDPMNLDGIIGLSLSYTVLRLICIYQGMIIFMRED